MILRRSTRRNKTTTHPLTENVKKEPVSPGLTTTVVEVIEESVPKINLIEPNKEKLSPVTTTTNTPIVKPEIISKRRKRPTNFANQDGNISQDETEFREVLENVINDILRSAHNNQLDIKRSKKVVRKDKTEMEMKNNEAVVVNKKTGKVMKMNDKVQIKREKEEVIQNDIQIKTVEKEEVIKNELIQVKREKQEVVKIEQLLTPEKQEVVKNEKLLLKTEKDEDVIIISDYKFEWSLDPQKLFVFAGSRPKLESLLVPNLTKIRHSSFSENETKIIEALNLILWSSKDSLKSLQLYPLGPFVQVKLPKLRNLTELILLPENLSSTGPMFPSFPVLNWQRTFPRLKKVNFNLNLYSEEDWEDFFPSSMTYDMSAIVKTVDTLQIAHPDRIVRPQFFQKLFPNVKKLILGIGNPMLTLGTSWDTIWTLYPDLDELDLIVPMSVCVSKIHKLSLDSKLTSIPLHSCPHVLKEVSSRNGHEVPETWQRDMPPSLRNLTKLRRLRIVVANEDDVGGMSTNCNYRNFHLISLVSCVYAFKLLPGLIVIVAFDHKLEAAPYIAGKLMFISNFIKLQHAGDKYENYFPKHSNN